MCSCLYVSLFSLAAFKWPVHQLLCHWPSIKWLGPVKIASSLGSWMVYIFYNRNDLLNLNFDINFDLFLFDTTVCSLLIKFLQPNDQYCKHTGGKFFYLCLSQEKANLFLYFVLTDWNSPWKYLFGCNPISARSTHTVFKKLLGLPRRQIAGLIL